MHLGTSLEEHGIALRDVISVLPRVAALQIQLMLSHIHA